MGKRKPNFRDRNKSNQAEEPLKKIRISKEAEQSDSQKLSDVPKISPVIQVQQKDKVERKVELIVKDTENNCHRSLTIQGAGLGVEKTIAVVEELKRNYLNQGTRFLQETSIKAGDNNVPHLQVILTLL